LDGTGESEHNFYTYLSQVSDEKIHALATRGELKPLLIPPWQRAGPDAALLDQLMGCLKALVDARSNLTVEPKDDSVVAMAWLAIAKPRVLCAVSAASAELGSVGGVLPSVVAAVDDNLEECVRRAEVRETWAKTRELVRAVLRERIFQKDKRSLKTLRELLADLRPTEMKVELALRAADLELLPIWIAHRERQARKPESTNARAAVGTLPGAKTCSTAADGKKQSAPPSEAWIEIDPDTQIFVVHGIAKDPIRLCPRLRHNHRLAGSEILWALSECKSWVPGNKKTVQDLLNLYREGGKTAGRFDARLRTLRRSFGEHADAYLPKPTVKLDACMGLKKPIHSAPPPPPR